MAIVYQPGRYIGRVESQYFTESPKRKTLGFCLDFRIEKDLDHPSQDVKQYQRSLVWWITELNANRVMQDLWRLGYTGKSLSGVDSDTEDFFSFVGLKITVECTHDTGTGSWGDPYERWSLAAGAMPNLSDKSKLQGIDQFLAGNRQHANGAVPENRTVDDFGVNDADRPR